MAGRFMRCVGEALEVLQPYSESAGTSISQEQQKQWLCRTKQRLWRLFAENPFTTCDWQERLKAIAC